MTAVFQNFKQESNQSSRIVSYPFNKQILKWIGNKQGYAHQIIACFPGEYKTFFDPFVGSGSIIATLGPETGFASDTNTHLINIFLQIKENPSILSNIYSDMKDSYEISSDYYFIVRDRFNMNPNYQDLLFLSRACYGGILRFRKSDGFMTTPPGSHRMMSAEKFKAYVSEWNYRISNTTFEVLDYRESLSRAKKGDLVYCDPPYYKNQGIVYGAHDFSMHSLLEEIERLRWIGVNVFLSIDNIGNVTDSIPDVKEIWLINSGRNRLNRLHGERRKASNRIEYLVSF